MTGNPATLDHQHGDGSAGEIGVQMMDLAGTGPTVVCISTCACGHMTAIAISPDQARVLAGQIMECATAADGGRGVQ